MARPDSKVSDTTRGAARDRLRDAEGFLDDAEHLLARAFGDGLEAAEVEAGEADAAGRTYDLEAEVGEEVLREHRLVHMEALVRGLALGIAVRERLQRASTAVACFADRGEEERLQHPRARLVDEVRARHEHRVVGRRARRQLVRARERGG